MSLLQYSLIGGKSSASNSKDTSKSTKVTYNELKTLRDTGKLIPGNLYRITDYECTTVLENTRSAGHQFDIVLMALSENKLAEEGCAMMHDNDVYDVTFADGVTKKCWIHITYDGTDCYIVDISTKLGYGMTLDLININEENKTALTAECDSSDLIDEGLTYNYFQNSNLSAWKVWYCLDNDKDRFSWANDSITVNSITNSNGNIFTRYPNEDYSDRNSTPGYAWKDTNNSLYYTLSEQPDIENDMMVVNQDDEFETVDYITNRNETLTGKGVIYRLIDEWNNDCPYDFKNIQYLIPLTDGLYDDQSLDEYYVYTFNIHYNDLMYDRTIYGNIWVDEINCIRECINNKIESQNYDTVYERETGKLLYFLPRIINTASEMPQDTRLTVSSNKFISCYDLILSDGSFTNNIFLCCHEKNITDSHRTIAVNNYKVNVSSTSI